MPCIICQKIKEILKHRRRNRGCSGCNCTPNVRPGGAYNALCTPNILRRKPLLLDLSAMFYAYLIVITYLLSDRHLDILWRNICICFKILSILRSTVTYLNLVSACTRYFLIPDRAWSDLTPRPSRPFVIELRDRKKYFRCSESNGIRVELLSCHILIFPGQVKVKKESAFDWKFFPNTK